METIKLNLLKTVLKENISLLSIYDTVYLRMGQVKLGEDTLNKYIKKYGLF